MLEKVAKAIYNAAPAIIIDERGDDVQFEDLRERGHISVLERLLDEAQAAIDALDIIILPKDAEPHLGDVVKFELSKMGGAGGSIEYHRYTNDIETELGGVIESSEIIQRNNKPAVIG